MAGFIVIINSDWGKSLRLYLEMQKWGEIITISCLIYACHLYKVDKGSARGNFAIESGMPEGSRLLRYCGCQSFRFGNPI